MPMTISSESENKISSPETSKVIHPWNIRIIPLIFVNYRGLDIIDCILLKILLFLIFFMFLGNSLHLNFFFSFFLRRCFLCGNRAIIGVIHNYKSGSAIFDSYLFSSISNRFLLLQHDFDDLFSSLNKPDVL